MHETTTPKAGALGSLRPQVGVPSAARQPLVQAIPVLVSTWALLGLYGSVGPSVVRLVVGSNSIALGGLSIFALTGAAGVAVLLLRNADARRMMFGGTFALAVGVGVALLSLDVRSAATFFVGTTLAGVGFGAGFQGAIRTILPLAA